MLDTQKLTLAGKISMSLVLGNKHFYSVQDKDCQSYQRATNFYKKKAKQQFNVVLPCFYRNFEYK